MIPQNEKLYEYCEKYSSQQDESLASLERETHLKALSPGMLSGHLQGNFLTMISQMIRPEYILEIGTYTGYSAICLAKGLNDGGKLITIDISMEYNYLVEKYIKSSGFEDRIQVFTGDAKTIIPELDDQIDLVFIDADKEAYISYYDMVKTKMKPGGIILADNVLWKGKVLDSTMDKKTKALHDFNEKIAADPDVYNLMLPLRDGINMIYMK
jgi:caffeoyl-CoA O-methyltransferase